MQKDITRFLEIVAQFEAVKEQYKALKEVLDAEMAYLGENVHFQDPKTKLVYEIVKPTGKFVTYDNLTYNRTKKPTEAKGTLSVKKAEEWGYKV